MREDAYGGCADKYKFCLYTGITCAAQCEFTGVVSLAQLVDAKFGKLLILKGQKFGAANAL